MDGWILLDRLGGGSVVHARAVWRSLLRVVPCLPGCFTLSWARKNVVCSHVRSGRYRCLAGGVHSNRRGEIAALACAVGRSGLWRIPSSVEFQWGATDGRATGRDQTEVGEKGNLRRCSDNRVCLHVHLGGRR